MTQPFRLETFDTDGQDGEAIHMNLADLEEAKLASFEKGYSAGWEDAVAAQEGEAAKLRADLGRNLQALAFSYHEARSHVLRALKPLLHDMVAKVLPRLARESVGMVALEKLMPLAEKLAESPLTVVVSPESRETVEAILRARAGFPLQFIEEPSLSDAQVYLHFDDSETRIDLDAVTASMVAAVTAFFQLESQGESDG